MESRPQHEGTSVCRCLHHVGAGRGRLPSLCCIVPSTATCVRSVIFRFVFSVTSANSSTRLIFFGMFYAKMKQLIVMIIIEVKFGLLFIDML